MLLARLSQAGLHARKRRSASTKAAFWLEKITGNKARDRRVNRELRALRWKVLRVWEHELRRKNERTLIQRLRRWL